MYGYTFTGSNSSVSFLPPFLTEVNFQGKKLFHLQQCFFLYPIAFRKTKIVYNFGLSECNKVKNRPHFGSVVLSREQTGSHKSYEIPL